MTDKELWLFMLLILVFGLRSIQWLDEHFEKKEQQQNTEEVYLAEAAYYADGRWFCEFERDGVWNYGVLDVSEDSLKKGTQVKVRVLGFEEYYILELA